MAPRRACGGGVGFRSPNHTREDAATRSGMLPPLLLLLLVAAPEAFAGKFDAYTSCDACVAAGFGWSVAKSRCGGYANQDCSHCEATAAPVVADPTHECSVAVVNAWHSYTPCGTPHECYGARIHHDLQRWQSGVGGITREQFLAAQHRFGMRRLSHYQIVDGQLYRDEKCMFEPRCRGVEYFFHWLLAEDTARGTAAPRLPNMELLLNPADNPLVQNGDAARAQLPVFSFSVNSRYGDIMYPAWTFWSGGPAISLYPRGLGRFDMKRESIIAAGAAKPWDARKDIAFFRGARTTPERDAIIRFSNDHPDLMDAAYTPNYKKESGLPGVDPVPPVELEDHCNYKYLLNARGVAASFRLKHLFLCESLVFNVGDVANGWLEFFYPALKPWVHYIPIREDMADAELNLRWAMDPRNEATGRTIARRGFELIRDHLRNEDVKEYWRELLTEYGKLLRWKVERDTSLLHKQPDRHDPRRGLDEMVFPSLNTSVAPTSAVASDAQ